VLVVDVGGTNVKLLATGQDEPRRFPSGPTLTAEQMVAGVKELTGEWQYDVVSIGYPGLVHEGRIVAEPRNLASGWVGFDFAAAFGCPVKLINDAAMQALGSYKGGVLLFLGLGTGLGAALVTDGVVTPMELGRLSYKKGTYADYVGRRGLKRLGKKKWRQHVAYGVERLIAALHPDDVVLGGGNAKKLQEIPRGCRVGDNAKAFLGGLRLWGEEGTTEQTPMTAVRLLLTSRLAWKALAAHHQQVRALHLRKLFAADPTRGERMTVEAVGLHLDYSKHRIPRRAAHAGHARQARGALRACRLHAGYNMEY
jgi:predicted NBD/HSP70 family sugar kinase